MYRKKEALVIILVLVVLLLAESGLALEKYVGLKIFYDYDDYGDCDSYGKAYLHPCNDCNMDCAEGYSKNSVGGKGCLVDVEEDDVDDNCCAYARVEEGFIINSIEVPENVYNHHVEADGTDDAWCKLRWANFVTDVDESYICGQNHYWYACVPDDIGQIIWVNKIIYNCTKSSYEEGEQYTWKEVDIDYDYDGYTEGQGDCMNVPSDNEICPVLDLSQLIGLPLDEIRTTVRSTYCSDLRYSTCAICINPGVPEVCGDKVNNDCGGPAQYEELTQLDGKTPDDCNKNKDACEQKETTIQDDGENASGQQQFNIYNEEFDWLETKEGGSCCGFNGIDDLSDTITTTNGDYLCLNKNTGSNLVGYDAGFTFGSDLCEGDWCWVPAYGNPQFKIFTIKKPGVKPYDIASNGEAWFNCDGEAAKNDNYELPDPNFVEGLSADDILKSAHRYRCYDEGDHYSWAECVDQWEYRYNKGIKGRFTGEGLFTLPLSKGDPAGTGTTTAEETRIGQNIDIQSGFYKDYYGTNYLFDFSGYDYLNFMVQFVSSDDLATAQPLGQGDTDLRLPTSIELDIYGPTSEPGVKPPIYFSGNVLGYVVNSNLFTKDPDNFMHIQVPLSTNYKGVSKIMIKSVSSTESDANFIKVKNIYLSMNETGAVENRLCSGDESTTDNSWLTDIDQGNFDKIITGKELCNKLYGKNAWLGLNNVVTGETASCCGNNPHEYYSGDSESDPTNPDGLKYACWNSQPVASGSTIMDVEFEVGYKELKPSISYSEETFGVIQKSDKLTYQVIPGDYSCPVDDETIIKNCEDKPSNCTVEIKEYDVTQCNSDQQCVSGLNEIKKCDTQKQKCYVVGTEIRECKWIGDIPLQEVSKLGDVLTEFDKIWYVEETEQHYQLNHYENTTYYPQKKVSIGTSPLHFGTITLNRRDFISPFNAAPYGGVTLTNSISSIDKVRVYLLNPRNNEEISDSTDTGAEVTYDNLPTNDVSNLYFMAELVDKSAWVKVDQKTTDQTQNLSFSCSQEECLYPLPGEPPYTIKNLHPELYELYFVFGSKQPQEQTPIGSEAQTFDKYGNVKVKKLAQPILFVSGDDTTEPNFYGCQAASYLEGENKLKKENNLPYCFVKAGQFCAHSTAYISSKKELYTTINSWSAESINAVGYEDVTVTDEKNLSAFYNTLELNLKNKTFLPETRNHTSIVLPTRNFLPNVEFDVLLGSDIPHWEILDSNGQYDTNENKKVNEKKVTIAKDETLRSERIGVEKNLTFSFSQKSTCKVALTLVDKNGIKEEVKEKDLKSFSTGSASYLVLEYAGPCTVEQPMLQLVDKAGPTTYNYNPKYIQRSAVACCPQTMCWNGYACVEEMSEMSHLAEHVADGRDYRCIDGQWTASPSKWDWNQELWGFCPEDDQCLVLASSHEGKKDKTFADFYNGEFPQCINNTQYIMDNYCNKGEWTSRTKFVATKLLEVVQTDDYILYCDNYNQALVELDEKENYIGGAAASTQTEAQSLIQSLNGTSQPQASALCFENVKSSAEGQRLVPDKKNTCVNNVCVLKYKSGGEWKVAFATTLNKPKDDPNSFLFSLDVPQSKLSTACTATGKNFAECPIEDLGGYMWFSPELNAVIYAKDSIPITPGTFDKISAWFSELFSTESALSDEHKFVDEAQNFRELYILKLGDKKVTAMQEIQNEGKQMLVAEYEGFTTPICDYLNNLKLPPEMGVELLEELSGMGTYNCTSDETTQRVEALEGLDFLWPQLTGKLRVEK